jgi:hypothetical protein
MFDEYVLVIGLLMSYRFCLFLVMKFITLTKWLFIYFIDEQNNNTYEHD